MARQVDGQIDMIDEWIDRYSGLMIDRQIDMMDGWMDGQIDDGWITRQMGRQIFRIGWIDTYDREMVDGWMARQIFRTDDRQIDMMDGWVDGWLDRYDGWMTRQTDILT